MQRRTRWVLAVVATLSLGSGCSSQAERERAKEREEAKKQEAYYNSPEFKAKQRAVMQDQMRGSSEAMRNYRFPNAPAAPPKQTNTDHHDD